MVLDHGSVVGDAVGKDWAQSHAVWKPMAHPTYRLALIACPNISTWV